MQIAIVRETECVGCAKCLPMCPVDAIIGAPKFLHSVLTEECIGCRLCVSPCPMDCIEMINNPDTDNILSKTERAHKAKLRYKARQKRLTSNEVKKLLDPNDTGQKTAIRQEIKAAIQRVQTKKLQRSFIKPMLIEPKDLLTTDLT